MVPFYHAVFLLPLAICIPQPGAPFGPRPLPGQVLYAMPNMFSCQDTEDCCNDLYSDYVTFSRTSGHPNPIESGGAKVVDFNGWAIQFGCKERGSSEEYTGWWLLRCAPSYDPALRRSKGMAKGDYKAFCMEIDYTKSRNKFVHVLDSVVECLDFEKFPLAVKPRRLMMIAFFLFSHVASILPPQGQQYAATPPPVWIDGKSSMSKYKLVPGNPQTTDLGCNSAFSDLVGASWMAGFNGWPVRSLGAIVQSTHWVSFRCVDVRFDKHLSVRYRKDPDVQGLFVIKCVEGSFPYLYTTIPEYKVKARCVKIAKATWKIEKIYHHTMNPPRLQMEENFFDDGTMSLFSRSEGRMVAVIEWPKQRRLNNRKFTFPIPEISGKPSTSKGKGSTICDDQEYMMQKQESSSSGSVVGLINSLEEFDLSEVDPK